MNPFYDTSDPEVLKAAALGITNGVGGADSIRHTAHSSAGSRNAHPQL